ncbi:MAG: hypothetical protein BROFUL_00283 [Candidatus Brocadia fulgida]|jgi:hypothetical protein|uniref:Uncharacterized protein n=1 Tax=Candidatus Brocadia fulgida TaxID=380242 RepID=A0A0M2UY14_9BACT|nr:MAG: hypothetical protein BROFUL_00283 [Candidatus Brocadia fulgida]
MFVVEAKHLLISDLNVILISWTANASPLRMIANKVAEGLIYVSDRDGKYYLMRRVD